MKAKFKKGEMVRITVAGKNYVGQFKNPDCKCCPDPWVWVAFPGGGMTITTVQISLSHIKKL